MLAWVFFLAVLGVTMAIPMKRQMINIEQLRFPSGIAAAETLRALHSHGEKAMRSAKALAHRRRAGRRQSVLGRWTAIFSTRVADLPRIRSVFSYHTVDRKLEPESFFGQEWWDRTVQFGWDPIFIAAGAMTGLRVSISIMLGGTLCWAVFVPIIQHYPGIIPPANSGYDGLVKWTLWGGAACMVTSGLFSFAMQWRSMLRAVASLANVFSREKHGRQRGRGSSRPDGAIETPTSWFIVGQLVSLVALALLANQRLECPFGRASSPCRSPSCSSLVACRVTGETDTTPVGAMGKSRRFIFGALQPGQCERHLDEREHHRGRRRFVGRPADRSEERLFARRQSAQTVPCPVRRHLHRNAGDGPLFSASWCPMLPCSAKQVSRPVRADLEGRGHGAQQGHRVARPREGLVHGGRGDRRHYPAAAVRRSSQSTKSGFLRPPASAWRGRSTGTTVSCSFVGAVIAYGFEKSPPEKSKEYLFPSRQASSPAAR